MCDSKFFKNVIESTTINNFVDQLTILNQLNENQFKFDHLNENDLRKKFIENLYKWLNEAVNKLSLNEKQIDIDVYFKCICSCLNAVRILSRDKESIDLVFNHDDLLKLIQNLAGLNDDSPTAAAAATTTTPTPSSPTSLSTTSIQILKLNHLNLNNLQLNQEIINQALKSMSNLIYNSKYVQLFYSKTSIIDFITIYIKEFNIKFYNYNSNICIFNLRILFLLTTFHRHLCVQLKENSQILTYLIEIIDQIIKDRLNDKRSRLNNEAAAAAAAASANLSNKNQTTEYSYLKSFDIDYLIELLKILFNLTMDKQKPNGMDIEEYEAHLMRLVSILRDLLTCKEEILDSIDEHQITKHGQQQQQQQQQIQIKTKLDELHSHIINLLLNMPAFCYEELLIPLGSSENNKVVKNAKVFKNKRLMKRSQQHLKQQLDNADHNDPDLLINDFEFEGKNVEAINIILRYLKKCLNLYLKRNDNNINVLNIKSPFYASDHLQTVLLLLTLMSKSNCIIRRYCRLKALPPLGEEVYKLPTEGKRLRNQLACLMTDANIDIKRLAEKFLFVLCKENIGRLIKYTGFGNSAGLIADIGFLKLNLNHDVDNNDVYSTDSESSDTEEYERIKDYVNQVTGRYEKDNKNLFDSLGEEQKEYIAHELMCCIDKLSKIGVVKPAAMDENGKLVEIEQILEIPDYVQRNKELKFLKQNREKEVTKSKIDTIKDEDENSDYDEQNK